MKMLSSRLGVAGAILAVAFAVSSASTPLDLQPGDIEGRIDSLLSQMTIEEKFGQLQQLDGHADGRYREEHLALARKGFLGSTLNVRGVEQVNRLQRAAVEESRLKIPLIFAFDVIHGYRVIFPIPLGEAASWDPAAAERSAAIAAAESRAAGLHWTFAPMVDIARDGRWGRIAEGAGEDPFLGAAFARARVRGFQGTDYSQPDRIAACAKHWVAYGAAEAGRDYNTTDMSERVLRSVYFPPFQAAAEAGVATFMSAFNDLNGVPTSGNPFTLTQVLRNEWRFDGMVVSDYRSVVEMIAHGYAADEADAARLALNAGVDMEMVSQSYVTNGVRLVREGKLSGATVDEAVRRVLRTKFRTGVFDRPFAEAAREKEIGKPEYRMAARDIAARSMVLLKNDGPVLPLAPSIGTLAVIGPLADNRPDMMGNWKGDGRDEDVVTILRGIRNAAGATTKVVHANGVSIDVKTMMPGTASDPAAERAGIEQAVRTAKAADAVILVLGETGDMSGEAASRASLDLPGAQNELAREVLALGRPTAVVLLNGRPLAIPWIAANAPAILEAWFPGTEAGNAVADVLFGKVNPGGKLPVTFPRTSGQLPLYYNHKSTGRPPAAADKYTSKYLDVHWTPLYPFGYGLSYTQFKLSDLQLSGRRIGRDGTLEVSVSVANAGTREGDEVVQVYVQDPVASVTRPVQELRGFQRITLKAGDARRVTFTIGPQDLGFYDAQMKWTVEPGEFRVRVSNSSVGGLTGTFEVR